MAACVALLLSMTVAVIPPLTDDQAAQLATATDGSATFDEAALYPLLINAAAWPDGEEAYTGAAAPDYAALTAAPEAHRGTLFLIEGRLAAAPRPFGTLSRPGSWDATLRQWPLLTDGGQVVLAYVQTSASPADLPPVGSRVRAVGRFYKVWSSEDVGGRRRDYLTFIGREAAWDAPSHPDDWTMLVPLLGAVLTLLATYMIVRRMPGRRRDAARPPARHGAGSSDRPAGYDPLLPRDPAQALARLAQQSQPQPESDRDAPR